jgi:LPXTG-site transpeptidase (sortase) family protein
LGHSAPPNWPKIKYDWVFSDLDALSPGDKIIVYIDYKEYTFTVKQKNILKRGEDITPLNLVQEGNYLALVSCWPPGKDLQRINIQATIDKN